MLALQTALGVLALGLCAFAPRSGGAVLLIPLSAKARQIDAPLLARYHLRLIGTGRLHGSFLVHADTPPPALELLNAGLVGLAAPAFLCGALP